MNRVMTVAVREFLSVVMTKAFVFGLVLPPLIGFFVSWVMVAAHTSGGPAINGQVVVIDETGLIAERMAKRLSADAERASQQAAAKAMQKAVEQSGVKKEIAEAVGQNPQMMPAEMTTSKLTVVPAKPEQTRDALLKRMEAERAEALKDQVAANTTDRIVALVEIPKGSVFPGEKGDYAGFTMIGFKGLDAEVQRKITGAAGWAVVEARVATDARVKAAGLELGTLSAIMTPPGGETKDVDEKGEVTSSSSKLDQIIPIAFMILLFISVMVSGQSLMTAVVEEKGSRVMELLLSAVSPMQLMTGKIVGQMLVGLLVMGVYIAAGAAALQILKIVGVLTGSQIILLLVYYVIAYLTVASLLAAIGAAVNEMREAQSLMSPVIMLLMVAFYGSFYVQRQPNSTVAVIASFMPVTSPFTMVSRLGGSEPIPSWHVPASIGVGIVTVIGCMWIAAKIFRVGVLMYGKAPNFATLIKWVRMA